MSETNPGPLQTANTKTLYDYLYTCQKDGLKAGIQHGSITEVSQDSIYSDGGNSVSKTKLHIEEKMMVLRKMSSEDTPQDNNYLSFYHHTQCLALDESSVGLEYVEDSDHLLGSCKLKREFLGLVTLDNGNESRLKSQNDDYIAIHDYKLLSGSLDSLIEQNAYLLITIFNSRVKSKGFDIALYFQIKDKTGKYNCYLVPKDSKITVEKVQIINEDDEKVKHTDHLHFCTTYNNSGEDTEEKES